MNYPQSIQKVFGDVVLKAQTFLPNGFKMLNYEYGSLKEIQETLNQKKNNVSTRWPLVWLVEDIPQDRANQNGFYADVSLNLIIATPTKKDWKSYQRDAETFDPVLRPIYWALLKSVSRTTAFRSPDEFRGINHTMTERKYWGRDDHASNLFSTFIDAIEITNLELKIDFQNCVNPLNID